MADRVSGKIVSGDPTAPEQATEVWTFTAARWRRPRRLETVGDPTS